VPRPLHFSPDGAEIVTREFGEIATDLSIGVELKLLVSRE
jgi:hypothetical protein